MLGTIVVFVVAAVCVRLGFWQLDRLEQREQRNALVLARGDAPAVDLAELAGVPDTALFYRRVLLRGGCEGEPVVLAARSRAGAPGVHLLCRFRTHSGSVVLLDRGWLPSADARTLPAEAYLDPPTDTVLHALIVPFPPGEAVSRPGQGPTLSDEGDGVRLAPPRPRAIYRFNRAEARAVTGLDLPPWYVQAIGEGAAIEGRPLPAGPPKLSSGPHLGYAIQWFSFAAIALIGWTVLVLRGGRPREGVRDLSAGSDV